jgi:uncharacterized protein YggE
MDDNSVGGGVGISVRGEAYAETAAERATVSLAVGFDGDDRRELEARAQRDAVAHAVDTASVYAAALRLDGATPVGLSEPSVFSHPIREDARMSAAGSIPVDLAPAPVRVDVAIDVRFAARPAQAQTD